MVCVLLSLCAILINRDLLQANQQLCKLSNCQHTQDGCHGDIKCGNYRWAPHLLGIFEPPSKPTPVSNHRQKNVKVRNLALGSERLCIWTLTLPLIRCENLCKPLNLLNLTFLLCKMRIVILILSQGLLDNVHYMLHLVPVMPNNYDLLLNLLSWSV